MRSKISLIIVGPVLCVLAFASNFAQSPALTPAKEEPVSAAQPVVSDAAKGSTQATLNSVQELKDANDEILKKQQATLAALDELQKAADQLKIFSKRG